MSISALVSPGGRGRRATRNGPDAVLRFAPTEATEPQAVRVETDVELFDFDAAQLGGGEVTEFVDENDEPERDDALGQVPPPSPVDREGGD